ncbi:hypothetical protein [Paenibacillus sp. BC26]|uniref:hypothetical protein n=1 Tax=Paenibacillus sp. BC26 TaxID=1881032 RepID=UPI0008DF1C53|nr:hypothetical protein [Paenibacillus sp. BC26]SFS76767.1 hypothetical protein SAMN05428962_2740 [Paenibacillus sp. BC26]
MQNRSGAGIYLDVRKNEIVIIPDARHEIGCSTYLGTIYYKVVSPFDLQELGDFILKSLADSLRSPIVTSDMELSYSKEFSKLITYSKYKKYVKISTEEADYLISPYRNYKRSYVTYKDDPEFKVDYGTDGEAIAQKVIDSFEFCKLQ